jgi:anaerobic selenocysteine-containing dehydrogenase
LQIRPGTDAALAMAWLNVIISEGLYDAEIVDLWCMGLDELWGSVKDKTRVGGLYLRFGCRGYPRCRAPVCHLQAGHHPVGLASTSR